MSWDSVCLVIPEKDRGSEVTGGGWRMRTLGCMRTRCLGFHEAGEGQRERTAEKLEGDMAVLNYPDQWKGGVGELE